MLLLVATDFVLAEIPDNLDYSATDHWDEHLDSIVEALLGYFPELHTVEVYTDCYLANLLKSKQKVRNATNKPKNIRTYHTWVFWVVDMVDKVDLWQNLDVFAEVEGQEVAYFY